MHWGEIDTWSFPSWSLMCFWRDTCLLEKDLDSEVVSGAKLSLMQLSCCSLLRLSDCTFLRDCQDIVLLSLPFDLHLFPFLQTQTLSLSVLPLSCLFNLLNLEFHLTLLPDVFYHLSSFFSLSLQPRPLAQTPWSAEHKHHSITRRSFSHSFHTDSSVLTKPKSHLPLRRCAWQPFSKVMLFPPVSFPLLLPSLIRLSSSVYTVRSWPAVGCGK